MTAAARRVRDWRCRRAPPAEGFFEAVKPGVRPAVAIDPDIDIEDYDAVRGPVTMEITAFGQRRHQALICSGSQLQVFGHPIIAGFLVMLPPAVSNKGREDCAIRARRRQAPRRP